MPIFVYKARNQNGEFIQGEYQAASVGEVATFLTQKFIIPISITAKKKSFNILKINLTKPKLKPQELIFFTRQMYSLIKAGVPLVKAIDSIKSTSESELLHQTLEEVAGELSTGKPLAAALAKHPDVFSTIYTSMIDAGENSGQLDISFEQLAIFIEREEVTKKGLKSVLRYPIMVVIMISLALFAINFLVVPSFAKIYASFHTELPLPTRILIGMSNTLVKYWYLFLGFLAAIIWGTRRYLKTPQGKYKWSWLRLKIPIFGSITSRIILGRFTRVFSMLVKSGVSLVVAIRLTAQVIDNEYVEQKLLGIIEGIEQGSSLSKLLENTGLFTPVVIQMLNIGEETGQVDELLAVVANYYESEVAYDMSRLTELMQPLMMMIAGVFVLLLALAVFLPIWDMVSFAHK